MQNTVAVRRRVACDSDDNQVCSLTESHTQVLGAEFQAPYVLGASLVGGCEGERKASGELRQHCCKQTAAGGEREDEFGESDGSEERISVSGRERRRDREGGATERKRGREAGGGRRERMEVGHRG